MENILTPFLILSFCCFFSVIPETHALGDIKAGESYLMELNGGRKVFFGVDLLVTASSERHTPVKFYQGGNNESIVLNKAFQLAFGDKYWKARGFCIIAEDSKFTPASDFVLREDGVLVLLDGRGNFVKIDESGHLRTDRNGTKAKIKDLHKVL